MKKYFNIWIVAFLGVFAPSMLWFSFDALVNGNCDAKFGCIGGLQFGMVIYGISGFVLAFIVIGVFLFFEKKFGLALSATTLLNSAAIGIFLGILLKLLFPDGLIILWLIIAVLLSYIVFSMQKYITR